MDNEEVKKVELVEELTNTTYSPEKNRFISNDSEAAAPRETSNEVNPLHTEQARILSAKDNER